MTLSGPLTGRIFLLRNYYNNYLLLLNKKGNIKAGDKI